MADSLDLVWWNGFILGAVVSLSVSCFCALFFSSEMDR